MSFRFLILFFLILPGFALAQATTTTDEASQNETAVVEEAEEEVEEGDETTEDEENEPEKVEREVFWDEEVDVDNGFLYYSGSFDEGTAQLVASEHDLDGDEIYETWLEYEEGRVAKESNDVDGDGLYDIIVIFNEDGGVQTIEGSLAESLTPEATALFVPNVPQASDGLDADDLVGDLSDISIEEKDNSWMLFIILLVVGGVLYFVWQRQRD